MAGGKKYAWCRVWTDVCDLPFRRGGRREVPLHLVTVTAATTGQNDSEVKQAQWKIGVPGRGTSSSFAIRRQLECALRHMREEGGVTAMRDATTHRTSLPKIRALRPAISDGLVFTGWLPRYDSCTRSRHLG
jgi:hypothetical protein